MDNKYINKLDYENMRHNYKNRLLLKYRIYKHNKSFLSNKLSNNFIINNIKLDKHQQEAIYTNEESLLILAGAGSGKTLTIQGKIKYLVDELHIKESEILCISFTNKTVSELKNKINYNIDIFTFHKLALEIISDYKRPYSLESSDYLNYVINEIFLSICNNISDKTLNSLNSEISSFINLFKNSNYDLDFLDRLIKRNRNKMLKVIKSIYLIYQEELASTLSVDLNDVINLATSLIQKYGFKRYYKYIIIDEYQDISLNRFNLINEIKKSCNSYIFAVGDDFQSIYKFTGSKINFIVKFKKYFKNSKILRLRNTYRNSNELIKVATNFIMKNGNQLKKKLCSNKNLSKPVKIVYYSKNMDIKVNKVLESLDDNYLILGRNTFDVNMLDKTKEYNYMTMHKSKGLEVDNVLIINLSSNYNGFPSKERTSVTNLLLKKDKYLFEEERRLFYVALTRTRNYVYLFVDKDKPSVFIKELLNKSKKYIEILNI